MKTILALSICLLTSPLYANTDVVAVPEVTTVHPAPPQVAPAERRAARRTARRAARRTTRRMERRQERREAANSGTTSPQSPQ